MTIQQPAAGASNLVERAKNIILTPRAEWDRIAVEPANTGGIIMGYVLPLAALAAIAGVIGSVVFGVGFGPFAFKIGLVPALIGGAIQLALAVVCVFLMGFIIDALAPSFGSTKDSGQALKLAAYSATAGYLAGLFAIYPALAPLSILGLYSIVLLYLGMPRLMKTPDDKRVGYIIAIIVVGIVLSIVVFTLLNAVRGVIPGMSGPSGFSLGASSSAPSSDTQIKIGGATIDVDEKAAKQIEQAFSGGADGAAVTAVDPALLQALLPASLPGGFAQSSASSSQAMGATQAEAEYVNGEARIRVQVMHMGAMGAMAGFAAAANVQSNEQSADGFSRTRTVDGRIYSEALSRSAGTVSYSVIGRNGSTISVEGSGGVSAEQANAVLNAIGIARVEGVGG